MKLDILVKHGKGEYLCHPIVLEPGLTAADIDFECLLAYNAELPVTIEVYIKKRSTSTLFAGMGSSTKSLSSASSFLKHGLLGALTKRRNRQPSTLPRNGRPSAPSSSSSWFSRVKSAMNLNAASYESGMLQSSYAPSMHNVGDAGSTAFASSSFGTQCSVSVMEATDALSASHESSAHLPVLEMVEENFELHDPHSFMTSSTGMTSLSGRRMLGLRPQHAEAPLGVMPCQYIYIPYPKHGSGRGGAAITNSSLPTSIAECEDGLERRHWNETCWVEGYLYQLGGDLNVRGHA
jgi:hypothetical protein